MQVSYKGKFIFLSLYSFIQLTVFHPLTYTSE